MPRWPSAPSRQVALSIDFILLYKFIRTRKKSMRSDIVLRPYIQGFHKRLLFSYQSGYVEARIYTRQFGWKCEFVCKKSRERELIYSKIRELCKFSDTIF